jgi:Tol biopolymer transport system component
MTRKLLVVLLAYAILVGCSKDDTQAPVQPSEYLVLSVFDEAANNYKLVKYNTDGSGEAAFISSRLTATEYIGAPAVSPKGKKVTYLEGATMKLLDVKTDARTNVYTHPNAMIGFTAFNADETKIAFSASPAGDERADLYIVNAAENSTPVRITNNELEYMALYPKFSTDGGKLTFSKGHVDDAGIYVSDLQGNNMVRVSENHLEGDDDAFPVFTIDGNKVIYTSSKYGQDNGTYELLMSNITEGAEGTATRMFEATASGVLFSYFPVVSPDNSFIYFIGVDVNAAQSIYKLSVSGGTPVKIKTVVSDGSSMVMNLAYVKE